MSNVAPALSTPRLTIELVPESCWFSNVRSNVSQEEWDRLRRATYRSAGYICEICGGRGHNHPVECHEKWFYDDENKIQRLIGLLALCPDCHEVKHFGLANKKGRTNEALAQLSKVNGWSIQKAEEYVDEQFHIWLERSKHSWILDVTWLEQYGIRVCTVDREIHVTETKDDMRTNQVAPLPEVTSTERSSNYLLWYLLAVAFLIALARALYYLWWLPNN